MVIQCSGDLQINKPIKKIYSLVDSKKSYESDWLGFKADGHYYVETEDDYIQKVTTMEEFFERLRTEQEIEDDDLEIVKSSFGKQKIKFKNLIATGELALTDVKLKEYGITQGGLRTAILAVIKSNQ